MSEKDSKLVLIPMVIVMGMIGKAVGILTLRIEPRETAMGVIFPDVISGKKPLMFLMMTISTNIVIMRYLISIINFFRVLSVI